MLPLLEKILAIKKPASGLPDSLLAQYRALAESVGFGAEASEKGLILRGKTVTLALRIEFGGRWDFFNTITALRETEADIKILVTSSNSRSMRMETAYTVLKKKLGEKARWVLLDIEGKKEPMFLNFSASDIGRAPAGSGSTRASRAPSAPRGGSPSPPAHPTQSKAHLPLSPPRRGGSARASRPRRPKGERKPRRGAKSAPPEVRNPPQGSPTREEKPKGLVQAVFDRARMTLSKYSAGPKPVLLKKTKNYGLQPADAPPRRKKIYGKRRKRRD